MLKSELIILLSQSIKEVGDGVVVVANTDSAKMFGTVLDVVNLPYESTLNKDTATDKLTITWI